MKYSRMCSITVMMYLTDKDQNSISIKRTSFKRFKIFVSFIKRLYILELIENIYYIVIYDNLSIFHRLLFIENSHLAYVQFSHW